MNPQDIRTVQQSFAGAFVRKADLAERFYVHLFARLPESQSLFRGNFLKQKTMLTAMIAACVSNLGNQSTLEELGAQLARKHVPKGLNPQEAEAATQALIAALRDVLGPGLDHQAEEAWRRAISLVAGMVTRH